jgi:hypothetical protein
MWVIHRQQPEAAAADCRNCVEHSLLVSMTDACSLSGITSVAVCALVASGTVHSWVASEGHLLICTNSLCRSLTEASQPVKKQALLDTE